MRRTALMLVSAGLVGPLVATPVAVYASNQFTDVPDSNPFHGDIAWLAETGITQGCSLTEYCPKDNVTREQMAAFLHRLADNQSQSHGVAGYITEIKFSTNNSDSPKSVTATCPAGKVLLGGGGGIGSVNADAPVAITSSTGFIDVGVPTWFVSAREFGAYAGNWNVTATIYCADPLP